VLAPPLVRRLDTAGRTCP